MASRWKEMRKQKQKIHMYVCMCMYEFMNVTSTNSLPDVCSFPSLPSACILRSNQWEHIFNVNQFTGIP